MGNLTLAELALVRAAVHEANASLSRAVAVIENAQAAPASARRGCGACAGEDFGDCPSCREPEGRVYGGGGADA